MERAGIWLAAILTLSAYSYLWKENPFFRIGEHLLIATNVSYVAITGFNNIKQSLAPIKTEGRYTLLVPVILGVLLFTRWFPKSAWLSRISVAFMMGVSGAVSITGIIPANFVKQIAATMIPLNSVNNVIIVFGTVSTVSYFLFIQGKSPGAQSWGKVMNSLGSIGKWIMMVAFGAAFGATVPSRLTLVMGRLQFLFRTWIPLVK